MDRTSKKHGCLKENGSRKNTYTQNPEKTTVIPWTHNEEGGLARPSPHGA